jgi:hypothetical protein
MYAFDMLYDIVEDNWNKNKSAGVEVSKLKNWTSKVWTTTMCI